jgi:hypothetical protein
MILNLRRANVHAQVTASQSQDDTHHLSLEDTSKDGIAFFTWVDIECLQVSWDPAGIV